jgi:hypothetical protein
MITSDTEAWQKYPFHRQWFNKLWLSEKLGYICGPNATPVPTPGKYIIRPIYNLHGMGAGAEIIHIEAGDLEAVPPGYFWCEVFKGSHLSVDLRWEKEKWVPTNIFRGIQLDKSNLSRFDLWLKVKQDVIINKVLDELWDCQTINIEMIGDKIIEVHLRGSPDPVEYTEMVPIWSDASKETINPLEKTHKFIASYDYVYGTDLKRLGFFCR